MSLCKTRNGAQRVWQGLGKGWKSLGKGKVRL